ncbi:MAG: CRISPR-associated endonuclease Cas3'' [Acidobacteria bacterium]|nr:CRISPR-associated endonuclease Cas3'' [Acidobacteriota bacterium]
MPSFAEWFTRMSGGAAQPYDWQLELAQAGEPTSRLLRVPTGMGKTLGVLAAWSWHRLARNDHRWPRRLVWCLPMRVLVEQTEAVARQGLEHLGLLWNRSEDHRGQVGVHTLMGGAETGADWALYPGECAVLVGTQDMLLSRALNRGYAAGRARWPLEFGLLGQDALWVMDEVQLMDVGLATSAQVQAFLDEDQPKSLRPRHTWWMSATLQPEWLDSVDTHQRLAQWANKPVTVTVDALPSASTSRKTVELKAVRADDSRAYAQVVMDAHAGVESGPYGRITLVVCNTVSRTLDVFDALRKLLPVQDIRLVHGRFRPHERANWRTEFLNRGACVRGVDRIVVATQVVEAGVDISAGCLVTDLAPWPSLVQRFGRCARYGGHGHVVVVDRGDDDSAARPYAAEELEAARGAVHLLKESGVGIAQLDAFESSLDGAGIKRLYPYRPKHLIIRREFEELFDTTPDLTGADIDISRFVRTSDDRDLQLFWTAVPKATSDHVPSPSPERQPTRDELCAVPFLEARTWLFGPDSKVKRLRPGLRAWVWDWLDGEWVVASRERLLPGSVVCVAADSGGYLPDRGFSPASREHVDEVSLPKAGDAWADLSSDADNSDDSDAFSRGEWKTIAFHSEEVVAKVVELASQVGVPDELGSALAVAARWHDIGKAHPAFQNSIGGTGRPGRRDLAKAPKAAWAHRTRLYPMHDGTASRPGFRHELVSALALFSVLRQCAPGHDALLGPWVESLALLGHEIDRMPQRAPTGLEEQIVGMSAPVFDLVVYLVASHHGKVRGGLHATPKDQDYPDCDGRGQPIRGVREADELPSVVLAPGPSAVPLLSITLQPAALGLSPTTGASWRERSIGLLNRYGPAGVAFLEALLIAADRNASALSTADPTWQASEVTP